MSSAVRVWVVLLLGATGCRFGYDRLDLMPGGSGANEGGSAGSTHGPAQAGSRAITTELLGGSGGWSGAGAAATAGSGEVPTSSTGTGGTMVGGTSNISSLATAAGSTSTAWETVNAGNAGMGGTAASCSDGEMNQDETAIDCGGSCVPCPCRYSAPTLLANPNYSGNRMWSPSITADALTIYFGAEIIGQAEQIAFATRTDPGDEFGLGQLVPAPVGQGTEGTPYVLPNNLALYFYSTRAGDRDLYVSRRSSPTEPFATVQALAEVNTVGAIEHLPWVSNDELTLYFTRAPNDQSNADIWRATRANAEAPFNSPELVIELNSDQAEDRATLSADQRRVIFASQRAGGAMQLYEAVRATPTEPFGAPYLITDLASNGSDYNPALTPSGDGLYFTSTRGGGNYQLWYAHRTCP